MGAIINVEAIQINLLYGHEEHPCVQP